MELSMQLSVGSPSNPFADKSQVVFTKTVRVTKEYGSVQLKDPNPKFGLGFTKDRFGGVCQSYVMTRTPEYEQIFPALQSPTFCHEDGTFPLCLHNTLLLTLGFFHDTRPLLDLVYSVAT